ncbi:MAG: BACON domain-containing protein [Bacteroidales bacterium]|nr:BACON domain-containing protein [Bacteroidales bacterium]
MKNIFKYLFAITIGAFLAVSCSEEAEPLGTKISADVASLSFEGKGASTKSVSVISDGDWVAVAPEWITVTPNFGTGNMAVQVKVADNLDKDGTLAAERKASLAFAVTGATCEVEINQAGDPDKKPAEIAKITVAQFNAAPESDAVYYELTGAITSVKSAYHGNFYLEDETGSVYVYGMYDKQGGEFGIFERLGLNQGDIVTIRGYRGSYNGLIEVMGGYYVSHVASLVSATPAEVAVPIEGGNFEVAMAYKGETFEININPEAKAWLNMGTIRPDGDTTRIQFSVAPNSGSAREAVISFTSSKGTTVSTVETKVKQDGSIADATIAEFLAQPVSNVVYYRLTGKVKSIAGAEYGNFYLEDSTGEVYVYGLTKTQVVKNDKSFPSLGIKVGDIVTIIGTRTEFKGTAQVGGPAYYVSHISHKEATVAEVLAASVGDDYYKLTGTIKNIKNAETGNFDLVDETGSIYVYGLTKAPVAKNDRSFGSLGIKEGDKVTLVGKRAEYKGSAQIGSAYYLYHEAVTE